MSSPRVLILMGSESDFDAVSACCQVLGELGIPHAARVASAHRTPARVEKLVREAEAAGAGVFICAAGLAAHLAGVVAAQTVRPVIGVPLDLAPLHGVDALYSMVQMPPGIPVACMGIGKAGARNAAWLAAAILALSDPALAARLRSFRDGFLAAVEAMDRRVQDRLSGATPS